LTELYNYIFWTDPDMQMIKISCIVYQFKARASLNAW